MKKCVTLFLACLLALGAHAQQPLDAAALDAAALDAYITKGMADFDIPGLAIGIVKDGKTVYLKGFGTRMHGKAEPVDPNTLFMIASNSKLFTGTILSHLVSKKQLTLDDKITKFYPEFRLYDTVSTLQGTVRDMLTHRIGTKTFQGDFTFLDGNLSRQEIMRRMRYLKPSAVFRQDYGYCNSCYLTAGMVAEKITGRPWEALVTDSILKPLGMARTSALGNHMPTLPNVAYPYTTSYTGKILQQPFDVWDNLGPAASIISSAADMTHWLQMQLDSGRYQGKRVLGWPTLLRTRDVQIVMGSRKSSRFPTHFRGYGLGIGMADYNGRAVYSHTGGAVGMVSGVCFVPEEKLGIVILTNQDNQPFFELLRYHLLDMYLGVLPLPDRVSEAATTYREELKAQTDTIAKWQAQAKKQATLKIVPPSLATGTYKNHVYGQITVRQIPKTNQYAIAYAHHPQLTATLAWLGGDSWLTTYSPVEYGIVQATVGKAASGKQTLTLPVNEFLEIDPYVFEQE